MTSFTALIDGKTDAYGVYFPDLPGCVAIGDTIGETERLIREAIVMHLNAMRDEGQQIPEPSTLCDYVEVQA